MVLLGLWYHSSSQTVFLGLGWCFELKNLQFLLVVLLGTQDLA